SRSPSSTPPSSLGSVGSTLGPTGPTRLRYTPGLRARRTHRSASTAPAANLEPTRRADRARIPREALRSATDDEAGTVRARAARRRDRPDEGERGRVVRLHACRGRAGLRTRRGDRPRAG